MGRWLAASLVAVAIAAVGAPVRAEDSGGHLTRALKLIEELDYQGAANELEAALTSGQNNPYELQLIYRLMGEVHGAYGRPNESERAFRHLLVLDPAAELADGLAPKIRQPFEKAQAWVEAHGTLVVAVDDVEGGGGREYALVVSTDPLKLVTGLRVAYQGKNGIARRTSDGEFTVSVPHQTSGEVVFSAVDRWGNELTNDVRTVTAALEPAAPAATGTAGEPAEPRRRSRSIFGHWALWGGLAVGAAATGAYFHVSANRDREALLGLVTDSENHEFTEAAAIERRTNRKLLWSQVSFGAGAAFAVTSVAIIVYDLTRDEPPPAGRVEVIGSLGERTTVGVRVAF